MRFHRIRDLVQWVIDFHAAQAAEYRRLGQQSQDPRGRMALDYLCKHEHQAEAALRRHLEAGDDALLDIWYDDPAPLPHATVLDRLRGAEGDEMLEDLTSTAIAVHRTLTELYNSRAATAGTGHETEFFTALANAEQSETRRMVRDMAQLHDF